MKIGIVGVTGAVGSRLSSILVERGFPVTEIRGFTSPNSVGKPIPNFEASSNRCEILSRDRLEGLDFCFFDVSDELSKEWVPVALEACRWVIDNSAVYRLDESVPLCVPEVNAHLLSVKTIRERGNLVSGPNCSTVQLVVALKPLQKWGIKRVVVTTLQSVSGIGAAGIDELKQTTQGYLQGVEMKSPSFAVPIAFNCIPQIGKWDDEGNCSEENKILSETRRILDQPDLPVSVTTVRIPTMVGHSESVNVEFEQEFDLAEVTRDLSSFPGIRLVRKPALPMPRASNQYSEYAEGTDPVWIGRLRRDLSVKHGLNLWIVSDNLRKGAALNAVQIAESILVRDSAFVSLT